MFRPRLSLSSDLAAVVPTGAQTALSQPGRIEPLQYVVRVQTHVRDCALIAVLMGLSMSLYIGGLGFYSDDWWILGDLATRPDSSTLGLILARAGTFEIMRPFEASIYALLYPLFHVQPLPYHVVNACVLITVGVLAYLALRELTANRLLSLSAALIYGLMPHYSTTRFWFDLLEVNISIALYLLSLYAALRATRLPARRPYAWLLASLLAAVASALWYELAVPLLVTIPLWTWLRSATGAGARFRVRHPSRAQLLLTLVNTSALMTLALFKLNNTPRAILPDDYLHYLANLSVGAVRVNFGWYGLAIPRVLWTILQKYFSIEIVLVALVSGLLALLYLYQLSARAPGISRRLAAYAIAGGMAVFALGYAIFLTNDNVGFTPTGANNRTAMAAALGVAVFAVGLFAVISTIPRRGRYRRLAFCTLVSAYAASGVLINNTIASFWEAASHEQRVTLAAIHSQFPTLPRNTSLLLSGVCHYIGPGVISDSPTSLTGALKVLYRDPSLRGAIVTSAFQAEDDALSVVVYGQEYRFPYGRLIVYRPHSGEAFSIEDRTSAETFLRGSGAASQNGCPPAGPEGYGVRIF